MTTGPVIFIVPGNPISKQSFRYVRGGGYQPQRVTTWEHTVSWKAREAMREREPITGPVSIRCVFVLDNNRRVDLGNLEKAVEDALNGIVYVDDSQIVNAHLVKKIFPKGKPGVLIEIHEGEELPPFYELDRKDVSE